VDANARLELDARFPTCLCVAVFPEHYTIPEDLMLKKVATKKLRDDILTFLLKNGASPDLSDKNGHTPIQLAIMQSNFPYLEEMLPFSKNLDLFDEKGHSALLYALDSEDPVKFGTALLKAGASINAVGNQGSALHYAVIKNRRDLVEFLLKNGANVDIPAGLGRTPLHFACNEKLDGMADVLVLHGANINAVDSLKRAPMHIAALKNSFVLIKYFVQQRARMDARDRDGNTALHLAAQHADVRSVEFLLDSGAEIDSLGSKGRTPLHFAVQRGLEPLVLLLLRRGASARVCDEEGATPVTLAVKRKLEGTVELMLQVRVVFPFIHLCADIGFDSVTPHWWRRRSAPAAARRCTSPSRSRPSHSCAC
jgi:ankyrin repeat protein